MSKRCNICYNDFMKLDIIVHEGESKDDMLLQLLNSGSLDYDPHYICRSCYNKCRDTNNNNCPYCRKKFIDYLDTSALDTDETPQPQQEDSQYKNLEKKYKDLDKKYKDLLNTNQPNVQINKVHLSEINENNVFEKIPKMYSDILKYKFYNETIDYIKGLKKYKDYGYSFGGNYTYVKWLINESIIH